MSQWRQSADARYLNSRTSKALLSDAITVCMNEVGHGVGEDVIRKFFRTNVSAVAEHI